LAFGSIATGISPFGYTHSSLGEFQRPAPFGRVTLIQLNNRKKYISTGRRKTSICFTPHFKSKHNTCMKPFEIKKILVPIDFSLTSMKALEHAIFMAKKTKGEITLMHVTDSMMSGSETFYAAIPRTAEFEAEIRKECEAHLMKLADKIRKEQSVTINVLAVSGNPRQEIIKAAEKTSADIIVMGTHGTSGVSEFVMGSNTVRVISEAKCPVLSVQQSVDAGVKKILVPFRNKPHSREKVDYAIALGKLSGASIHVLGVDVEHDEEVKDKLNLEAEQIKKIIEGHGLVCETKVITGAYLSDEILGYAKEIQAGLIVIMADLDRMSVSDFIMGPFAQQIVNHSHIPILSIRPTFNADTVNLKGYGW
jgi:nucleotide-binding universal stress UspA family protein